MIWSSVEAAEAELSSWLQSRGAPSNDFNILRNFDEIDALRGMAQFDQEVPKNMRL